MIVIGMDLILIDIPPWPHTPGGWLLLISFPFPSTLFFFFWGGGGGGVFFILFYFQIWDLLCFLLYFISLSGAISQWAGLVCLQF
jgi:hypothetical protein